ncbi:hypothetical protein AQI95_39095 [Streptomyces yokosukanensis]|uniref:Helicase-associated domain-containing protein n=1 Tax=Streptomyces yokosukanensis TaxID=67386 RepID=A0A117PYR0_9ACTN|nr:helicase associated domain-containing protein [Streptomyces yokosukanensis]KUM99411.1 hypothetical protein AQI95_39095 [Streptomyces yokosukanensis]
MGPEQRGQGSPLGVGEPLLPLLLAQDVLEDQEERQLRLGAWIGNQRSRAATLSPERVEQLSAIGMRWS